MWTIALLHYPSQSALQLIFLFTFFFFFRVLLLSISWERLRPDASWVFSLFAAFSFFLLFYSLSLSRWWTKTEQLAIATEFMFKLVVVSMFPTFNTLICRWKWWKLRANSNECCLFSVSMIILVLPTIGISFSLFHFSNALKRKSIIEKIDIILRTEIEKNIHSLIWIHWTEPNAFEIFFDSLEIYGSAFLFFAFDWMKVMMKFT